MLATVTLRWTAEFGYTGRVYIPEANGLLVMHRDDGDELDTLRYILGGQYAEVIDANEREFQARAARGGEEFPIITTEQGIEVADDQVEELLGLNGRPGFELGIRAERRPDGLFVYEEL